MIATAFFLSVSVLLDVVFPFALIPIPQTNKNTLLTSLLAVLYHFASCNQIATAFA